MKAPGNIRVLKFSTILKLELAFVSHLSDDLNQHAGRFKFETQFRFDF
jgi:hypothetical protein